MSDEGFSADRFRETAAQIEDEVGKVIVGQRELVRHTLVTLLAGGNPAPSFARRSSSACTAAAFSICG